MRAADKNSEEVMMQLLYSCCVPILSYACPVKQYSSRQMQDCCTALVAYSCPVSYSSYAIRVALSLSCFPLRFALTYPRRLSCPLPRPLICQPLAESLVVMNLVDRVLSLAVS